MCLEENALIAAFIGVLVEFLLHFHRKDMTISWE